MTSELSTRLWIVRLFGLDCSGIYAVSDVLFIFYDCLPLTWMMQAEFDAIAERFQPGIIGTFQGASTSLAQSVHPHKFS